jgi:uncharacterized protein
MIIDKLLESSTEGLARCRLKDVRIGLGYTAVLLDDGACGLAGTLTDGTNQCCTYLQDAGELIGKQALEVAKYAVVPDPVAATVGVATLNASLNRDGVKGPDLMSALPIDQKVVGMVGFFEPFIQELRLRAKDLYVFEKRPLAPGVLPDWAAERIIPKCDVVILTAISLINGTLDRLLQLSRGEVALVGPTTPLSPVLREYGVKHLFGSVVTDAAAVMNIVSQAGGTQRFGSSIKKVYQKL